MKNALDGLLMRIRRRREILLKAYDEEHLHQLRVEMRRLRGLLRFADSPDARALRQDWGNLITHTNMARDWDTLAARVEALPGHRQPVGLLDAITAQRADVANLVSASLRGEDWDASFDRMRSWLDVHATAVADSADTEAIVAEAAQRANRAWAKARDRDASRAWHKLRIAVKDLRYSLDTLPLKDVDKQVALCKSLQEHLGIWHDSIVHRELLDTIADRWVDREGADGEGVARLRDALEREGEHELLQARKLLANMESASGSEPFDFLIQGH